MIAIIPSTTLQHAILERVRIEENMKQKNGSNQMVYVNLEEVTTNQQKAIQEEDRILELLNLVWYGKDYNMALEKSLAFANENSVWLKGSGIECFGHIARIYKNIDLKKVHGIINEGLKSENKIIAGKAKVAMEEICFCLKLDKQMFK